MGGRDSYRQWRFALSSRCAGATHANDHQRGLPIHSHETLPSDPQIVQPATPGTRPGVAGKAWAPSTRPTWSTAAATRTRRADYARLVAAPSRRVIARRASVREHLPAPGRPVQLHLRWPLWSPSSKSSSGRGAHRCRRATGPLACSPWAIPARSHRLRGQARVPIDLRWRCQVPRLQGGAPPMVSSAVLVWCLPGRRGCRDPVGAEWTGCGRGLRRPGRSASPTGACGWESTRWPWT